MSDGPEYLSYAHHLSPNPDRPVGYSIFLRGLSEVSGSLALVTSVQLVLGLLGAVAAYALLRRWGVAPWVATLATVPMLFDAMQLLFEHAVLSDMLFDFLVVVAVAALAWWPTPRAWTTLLAGGLLGLATVVRVVGEPTVVLAALFLLLVAGSWRARVVHVVLVLAAFAVPVTAYAAWYHDAHGSWALSQTGGRALYMRTTTFVDCSQVQLPRYERVLCPQEPLGQRRDPTWYGWHSPDTVPRLHPPAGRLRRPGDARLRDPGDQGTARATTCATCARDFGLGFVSVDRNDHFEMQTSVKWKLAKIVAYEHSSPSMRSRSTPIWGASRPRGSRAADVLGWYGRIVYVPGPLALLLVGVAVAGVVVRRRDQRPSLRPLALLTLALPLVLVLVPDVTAQFVWRYQLPLVVLLPLSAALGWTRLRGPGGAGGGETPGRFHQTLKVSCSPARRVNSHWPGRADPPSRGRTVAHAPARSASYAGHGRGRTDRTAGSPGARGLGSRGRRTGRRCGPAAGSAHRRPRGAPSPTRRRRRGGSPA